MNIKLTLLALLALLASYISFADQNAIPQNREIIGSGIIDINKTRKFSLNDESKIYQDSMPIDIELFEIIGSGFKSKMTLSETNSTLESGTINSLQLITNIVGPITSVNPLKVLEQSILVTSDTVNALENEPPKLNQVLAISGDLHLNNSIKASKLMKTNMDWVVRGIATNVSQNHFNIGSLTINLNNVSATNCQNDFIDGAYVQANFLNDPDYSAGQSINSITSLSCIQVNDLMNIEFEHPAVFQGFISEIQGNKFQIGDIAIFTSPETSYINGEKNFIDDSVNIEVQGIFNSETSEIDADQIRFIDHRFEITFPIQPPDISINHSINIMGQTFYQTPQTKFSQILSNGIDSSIQIQIQGYIDSQGNAYISKVLNKGVANFNKVSLRGNVYELDNPFFKLLNFQIDASNSQIISLGSGNIDIDAFFNMIKTGSQLEIKNAAYNESNDQITGGRITIRENINDDTNREIIGSGIIKGFAYATITASSEKIFRNTFD